MPVEHRRRFRVRHYETDAYGHVNHANYLRYMQEAAFDASAAVGYDEARYAALGTIWLIRSSAIEYLHSLRYGDMVEVRTWVSDFRRVRSRRDYELTNTATGTLIARASTDWVYLDRASGRPLAIPSEMIAAFAPELDGASPPGAARAALPAPPPPPPGMFTMRRRVEWRDIDTAGHVNNAVYLNYMEECGIQAAAAVGWTVERMCAEGFAIMARRHQIEYRQQAPLGMELTVSTYLSDVRRSSATRHFIIARADDGTLIAQARSLWAVVDLREGRLMRVPPHFVADFATSIAAEGS